MKILVVEDNPVDLKLVRSVLKHAGHEIREAGSAEEAMDLLHADIPELILTDLQLPHMDGLAMTRVLKRQAATSGIPVVAMSSFQENFPKVAIRKAGFADYLSKPLNTRTLARQLADSLKRNS